MSQTTKLQLETGGNTIKSTPPGTSGSEHVQSIHDEGINSYRNLLMSNDQK